MSDQFSGLFNVLQTNPILLALAAAVAKSSGVLLIVWGAMLLLRRRSAAVRHLLWTTALACSLALLVLPSVIPSWKVLPKITPAATQSSVQSVPETFKVAVSPIEPSVTSKPVSTRAAKRGEVTSAASASRLPQNLKASIHTVTPKVSPSNQRTVDWKSIVFATWLLGIFCCATFYFSSEWKLRKLARISQPVVQNDWLDELANISLQLGLQRKVQLLSSADTEVPLTFGLRRPVIVLPNEAIEWTAVRREAVLRHEMAHIVRWDVFTQAISHAACAIYWFNPLAWIAARAARFERELACDDYVLASGAVPSDYAGELLTMVSRFQQRERYAAALAMARKSQFEGRLLALLNPERRRKPLSRRAAFCAAFLAAALAVPLAAMAPQDVTRPIPATPATQATPATTGTNVIMPGGPTAPPPLGGVGGGVEESSPEPALAPRAEEAPEQGAAAPAMAAGPTGSPAPRASTPAPEGWGAAMPALAPHAATATTPRPDSWEHAAALPALADTPRAEDNPRRKRQAVVPPPARQTGLECIVTNSEGKNQHSSTSINDDGNIKSMTVSWSNDDCTVGLNSRGDIKFTDDFTGIQSVSQDGFVEINARIRGETRRLSLHNNGGQLEYGWWVNGNKQPFDDAGRKWLANFLVEMDRHNAWAAKQRYPALMREGGVQRVLDEVSYMESDYSAAIYLIMLLDDTNLKSQEVVQTLRAVANLSSDYEEARVLMAVANKYSLNDPASRNAFLAAIDNINSDYEHARVLMAFFNKGPIPIELARTVLNSASKLRSDYEHSRVLQEMAKRGLVDANTQADFLASVNNIHSDYEHSQSLLAFLQARKSDDAAVLGVIKAASQIQSDYEHSRVLTTVAGLRTLNGAMRDEYIQSAQQIHSEYERNRALAAIAYHATSL